MARSKSQCRYGTKLNGSCKKKPGPKSRSRRRRVSKSKYRRRRVSKSRSRRRVSKSRYRRRRVSKSRSRRRRPKSRSRSCRPGKNKKFAKVVNGKCVRFGDPNMTIKKNKPGRKKSFCARHKCHLKTDKATAGYQSCLKWNCRMR